MVAQQTFLPKEQVREVFRNAWAAGSPLKVEFVKRTSGERRVMTCTQVPPSQLRAGARSDLDAAEAETLFVWDVEKSKPASVPVEAVLRLEYEPPIPTVRMT